MSNRSRGYRADTTVDLPHSLSVALGSRLIVGGSGLYRSDWLDSYPWGEKRWSSDSAQLCAFDIKRSDRAYWYSVKVFLTWLARALPSGRRDWAHFAYKYLRRLHHESKAKGWEQVLPKPIVAWAWEVIFREQKDLSCCDNARVALVGNTGQVRRYKAAKAAGCCGFSDAIHTGPDGKRYMIGFNFGH
jgi:hypothetical protein